MKLNKLAYVIATVVAGSNASMAIAENVSLFDYEDATSAYEDAYINADFNLQSGNQDQTSYDLDLNLDYEKVLSSPDRNTKIDFSGYTSKYRGGNANDPTFTQYNATGSVTLDNYFEPNSNGAFWYGKGELGLQKDMEDPYTKATVGIGYGRVVVATPMAKSIRLVEALTARNILAQAPSKAVYQAIANVIAREDEYRAKYGAEDYEMTWIQDIENALGGNLGVQGAIKSYDILLNERISTRKYGWLVRAGVGAVLSDYDGSDGKPALELGAEYHMPLNNATQFSNEAIFTAVLDDDDDSYRIRNEMSLTYEMTDRVDWENSWVLDYLDNESTNDVTTNVLASTYRYYISNALSFSVTGALTNLEDGINGNNNDKLDKSLVMGLTYRLK
ncbi:DUF481 domain-containing protein [Neptunomonas antarctica]|uniref:DUF481 domain-containing protein n=1 Tax=Neptunomonas antarctica TaxID=619304 RepID=A0A1N7J2B4_9GAMM|nr:DUF481 domain-containing protein [Neptunomonas antarctica]SIS43434.1 Protein of unknown function, DUF481 [Neptunomonas antarctica]